jgi:acyl carrier protein
MSEQLGSRTQLSAEAISDWLVSHIANDLGIAKDEIRLDEAFVNLGLSSRHAILMTGKLEDYLGLGELDPSLLWEYPTIEALVRHLVSRQTVQS